MFSLYYLFNLWIHCMLIMLVGAFNKEPSKHEAKADILLIIKKIYIYMINNKHDELHVKMSSIYNLFCKSFVNNGWID